MAHMEGTIIKQNLEAAKREEVRGQRDALDRERKAAAKEKLKKETVR